MEYIAYVTVESSMFLHCFTTGNNDEDGGCIVAVYISKELFGQHSFVIDSAANDGSGISSDNFICSECHSVTDTSFLN